MSTNPIINWTFSGSLLGLSFLFHQGWIFGFFGFIALLYSIKQSTSRKERIYGGFLVGILLYAGALRWFWYAFPLPGFGEILVPLQLFIIGFYWLFSCVLFSLGTVVFTVYAKRLLHTSTTLITIPLLWFSCELLGMFLYSLGSLGSGGKVGANFGFGQIGSVFAGAPFFMEVASICGMYGLTLFGVFVCVTTYLFLERVYITQRYNFEYLGLVVCIIVLAFSHMTSKAYTHTGKTVIAVETYFSKDFFENTDSKQKKNSELRNAVMTALLEDADTVVLPEDSRFLNQFKDETILFSWIHEVAPEFDGILVDSGRVTDDEGKIVLRGYVFDVKKQKSTYIDKQFLVPQGEFLSYVFSKFFTYIFPNDIFALVYDRFGYRPGVRTFQGDFDVDTPVILFCSESAVPYKVYDSLKKHKSLYVVHPVSHAWFEDHVVLLRQVDTMLQVHAMWNDIPIVSAANAGNSFLYLPDGIIEQGTTLYRQTHWSIKRFDL